jgi:hypothetical protein
VTDKKCKSMKLIKSQFPNFKDFTGDTFGWQLVCGYLGKGLWLLKCNCGKYSSRKTHAVKSGKGSPVCSDCRKQIIAIRTNKKIHSTVECFIDKYVQHHASMISNREHNND